MKDTNVEEKNCSRCGLDKPLSAFDKQKIKGKYYYKPYCSGCKSKKHRKAHPEVRKNISDRGKRKYRQNQLKMKLKLMETIEQTTCKNCKYSDIRALTFHHKEGEDKCFTISYGFTHSYSFDKLLEEAKKCDILCQNCHIIHHCKLIPL